MMDKCIFGYSDTEKADVIFSSAYNIRKKPIDPAAILRKVEGDSNLDIIVSNQEQTRAYHLAISRSSSFIWKHHLSTLQQAFFMGEIDTVSFICKNETGSETRTYNLLGMDHGSPKVK